MEHADGRALQPSCGNSAEVWVCRISFEHLEYRRRSVLADTRLADATLLKQEIACLLLPWEQGLYEKRDDFA